MLDALFRVHRCPSGAVLLLAAPFVVLLLAADEDELYGQLVSKKSY